MTPSSFARVTSRIVIEVPASILGSLSSGFAWRKFVSLRVASLVLLLMLGSAGLRAGSLFRLPQAYDVGNEGASSIAVADVNLDGIADLVLTADGAVSVLLGNGDGSFKAAQTYAFSYASAVAVGDVNNDGKPDIVVTGSFASVGVFLGNGDGSFKPVQVYGAGSYTTSSIALGDLNGDGKLDVVIGIDACAPGVCGNDGAVGVLLGNGDGSYQKLDLYDSGGIPGGPFGLTEISLAVADVNGDGKLDVVVANPGPTGDGFRGVIGVLLGRGNGTLKAVRKFDSGGFGATSVTVADVNNDGHPDLVVANYCSLSSCDANGDGNVAVLLGNGNGSFKPAQTFDSAGYSAVAIAVRDVNRDGHQDLIVLNSAGHIDHRSQVAVLLGNEDGTFQAAQTYSTRGHNARAVAVTDINGDTKLDLIVANANFSGDGTAAVLLGK